MGLTFSVLVVSSRYERIDTTTRRDRVSTYTCRAQTVLTEEQYSLLRSLSVERGKPISVLIREAIEQVYLHEAIRQRREAAVERLLALEAPVGDWQQMEEGIARAVLCE
jgi:hypothetical protein